MINQPKKSLYNVSSHHPENTSEDRIRKDIRNKRIIKWLWIIAACTVVFVGIFFALIYNGVVGYMPPIEELKNPKANYASIIYSADGAEMGRYYRNTGNRVYADFNDISNHVIDALIATEDARFESHSGIDAIALWRVAFKTLLMQQKNAGGGSTITQQLAKQLYSSPTGGLWSRAIQKPIEWMIALKLERFYSKEEIIKMYLNQFDFLYNAVGIQSAAQVYFNKKASDLNIQEAALLIGMVKNPSIYNPRLHPENALARRNTVFDQMYKADMITRQERDSLSLLPIELHFQKMNHKDGIAPYFREELRRYLTAKKPERTNYPSWDYARFVTDSVLWANNALYGWVAKNPKSDGSFYDIYTDGLKIYTTIDTAMQSYAEQAVAEQLKDLQARFDKEKKGSRTYPYTSNQGELSEKTRQQLLRNAVNQSERARVARLRGLSAEEIDREFDTPYPMTLFSWAGAVDTIMTPRDSILYVKGILRAGFMAMDPRNGYVKAYVGGPDFKFFQYDMVSTGKRQVGSTMKPFLYTLAMEDGFTPCSMFLNDQPVFTLPTGQTWAPRNANKNRVGEMVDLRWALTNSNNWISARVIEKVGPQRLANYIKSFGVTSHMPPVMSLALGPAEISLIEMVTAYTAFANEGMRVDPLFVRAITDSDGNIITRFTPNQTEVIGRDAYYRILSILLNVVDSGTGNRVRSRYGITAQMGGKTGTTNYNADGWFMAFTPTLVAGTWVGGDERYIHFNSMRDGQGAEMALPVFGRFMRNVYNNPSLGYSQDDRFVFPVDIEICPDGIEEDEYEEVTVDESIFD
ncbi:MAG: transglycosylase domain-containing protein [Muribaculaceae bacterium]|nr:transglycosylase domain-containing protein [Muribaculaceae bacterium]